MKRWAQKVLDRHQTLLFNPTLDSCIDQDHPVRLFDEILSQRNWSDWNSRYVGPRGQPPIPPQVMASVILYGLSMGIRSSRRLEWACHNALDYIWLSQGRKIDHSTFCHFRTKFETELKGTFRQIGRLALRIGLTRLNQVLFDGTRIKAHSNRDGATACAIESRIAELDRQIEKMFSEAHDADQKETDLFGASVSPNRLPAKLGQLEKRRALLKKAQEVAEQTDRNRQARSDSSKKPAHVSVTDPDSRVMPNKEGGFAPNYTPVVAVDAEAGLILDADVINSSDEAVCVEGMLDRIQDDYGQPPEQAAADAKFSTGAVLSALDRRGVEAYMPVKTGVKTRDNPAVRADPTQAVAPADWSKLPRSPQNKTLARECFIYDAQTDCYYCPLGKKLDHYRNSIRKKTGVGVRLRHYRGVGCANCPLAGDCIKGNNAHRTICRDAYEDLRDQSRARTQTPLGRELSKRRLGYTEGVFGLIKSCMGLRQFLLRGLEKVRTEWLWACTAYNLKRLVSEIINIRRSLAALSA